MLIVLLISMTALPGEAMFFGGGCGCRQQQQQCSCAPPPVQSYCPPPPCGRSSPSYPSYAPVAYRPPPPPLPQQYYSVPQPIPTPFQNSYQQPLLANSYNAPQYSNPTLNTYNSVQNAPIQVASAKEINSGTSDIFGDTVIQKSKTLSSVKNEIDEDVNALSNFENTLQAYKSMSRSGIRRSQGTKIEIPEKCSSARLQEIMEKAMTSSVSVAKLKISQGAKRAFGYNFDVICSQFDFSYLISSNIYCRVQVDGQTCLAYEN